MVLKGDGLECRILEGAASSWMVNGVNCASRENDVGTIRAAIKLEL